MLAIFKLLINHQEQKMVLLSSIRTFSLMLAGASVFLAVTTLSTNAVAAVEEKVEAVKSFEAAEMTKVPTDANFKQLDENSDGKISLQEAAKDKGLFKTFESADANEDGSITSDEYAKYALISSKNL